jgi:ribonuclease-3
MSGFKVEKAEKILGIKIKEAELFETAFTHRSYLNEHPKYKNPSNERLEFLGDAVLQHLSSEFLYKTYPGEPEGQLTNYRSAIVNTVSLAKEAKRLGYGELLLFSKGEEATGGRTREYILANTFEAVLGALYLHEGIEFCRKFTTKELFYKVESIIKEELYKDSKSKFQEIAQEKMGDTPVYKVMKFWGADHEKSFRVGVYINNELYGEGEGRSKQKAEQNAAVKALDKLLSV